MVWVSGRHILRLWNMSLSSAVLTAQDASGAEPPGQGLSSGITALRDGIFSVSAVYMRKLRQAVGNLLL